MSWIYTVEDILGTAGGNAPEYQFQCPFCLDRKGSESSKQTLRINAKKGKAICFRCEYASSSVRRILSDVTGRRYSDADIEDLGVEARADKVARLSESVINTLYPLSVLRGALRPVPLPEGIVWLNRERKTIRNRSGWRYLERRGADDQHVARHDIGLCMRGVYRKRLIFPVWQNRELVYWTNRYCGQHDQKSLNPPNDAGHYTKDECLLGFDLARKAPVVVVVEGAFDMMAFDSIGIPAVALLGKRVSNAQVQLMRQLVDEGTTEIVIATDVDADEAKVASPLTTLDVPITRLPLEEGDPWDERDNLARLWDARAPLTLLAGVQRAVTNIKRRTQRVGASRLSYKNIEDTVSTICGRSDE